MKFALVLSLAICLINAVYCLDVTFKNLCKEDHFDYENRQVNAFFKVQYNHTISDWFGRQAMSFIDFSNWSLNETEILELRHIRDTYNQILKDVYTTEKLNKMNATTLLRYKIFVGNAIPFFDKWWYKVESPYEKNNCYYILSQIKGGNEVIGKLLAAKRDQLNEQIIPENFLINNIIELNEQLNGTGRLAFTDLDFYRHYAEN